MSLQPLRNLGHSDIRSENDLRTWQVVARDGTRLGTVAEVLVDVDEGAPVYLHVLPHGAPEGAAPECWIRVPYRHARVDDSSRRVILSDIATLGLGTATTRLLEERTQLP